MRDNLGASTGSRPTGQAPAGLDASRIDPERYVVFFSTSFGSEPPHYWAGRIGKETPKKFNLAASNSAYREVQKSSVVLVTSSRDGAIALLEKLNAARQEYVRQVTSARANIKEVSAHLIEMAQGMEAARSEQKG